MSRRRRRIPVLLLLTFGVGAVGCSNELTDAVDSQGAPLSMSTPGLWTVESCASHGDLTLMYLDASSGRVVASERDTSWARWLQSHDPNRDYSGTYTTESSELTLQANGATRHFAMAHDPNSGAFTLSEDGRSRRYTQSYAAWCTIEGRANAGIVVNVGAEPRLVTFGGDGQIGPKAGVASATLTVPSLFAPSGAPGTLALGSVMPDGSRVHVDVAFESLHLASFAARAVFVPAGATSEVVLPLTCRHATTPGC